MTNLTLPSSAKIAGQNFRLDRRMAINALRGGYHQVAELANPLWVCELETTQLSRALGGQWKWLLSRMKPGQFIVELWDAGRPLPYAYRSGGSWGSPTVTAVSYANSTITLGGLAAGAIITEGDYGAWQDGPARRLHILGSGVADGSGVVTLDVEPRPPSTPKATLPVAFDMSQASAEFVITDFEVPFEAPTRTHKVSLTAAQVLKRV